MRRPITSNGLYINLPVADLARTRAFFEGLGFAIDPRFSDDNALAVVLGPHQGAMMLRHEFFARFTDRKPCDTATSAECLVALELESRDAVDAIVEAARANGGGEPHGPEDFGFMYQRSFTDPDGHGWGPFWMDPAHAGNAA